MEKIGLIILGLVLILALSIFLAARSVKTVSQQQTPEKKAASESQLKTANQDDHLLGNLYSPVQLIVYSDFECPACESFSETVCAAKTEFGDELTIVFRHFPLSMHENAMLAANAAECASEQGFFWPMHDKIFEDNRGGVFTKEEFMKDATELNLEVERFSQCLTGEKYRERILTDMGEGRLLGINGTPSVYLNGTELPGAIPFEDYQNGLGEDEKGLKSLIVEVLAE